jgi:hypothetical protein
MEFTVLASHPRGMEIEIHTPQTFYQGRELLGRCIGCNVYLCSHFEIRQAVNAAGCHPHCPSALSEHDGHLTTYA